MAPRTVLYEEPDDFIKEDPTANFIVFTTTIIKAFVCINSSEILITFVIIVINLVISIIIDELLPNDR